MTGDRTGSRLSLHAVLLAGATASGQLILVAVMAATGRSVGPAALGGFAVAFSVAAFANALIDFGANYSLLRGLSSKKLSEEEFGRQIWVKLCVAVLVAAGLLLVGLVVPHGSFQAWGAAALLLSLCFSGTLQLPIRAQERNTRLAVSVFSNKVAMGATFTALRFGHVPALSSVYLAFLVGMGIEVMMHLAGTPRALRPRPCALSLRPWRGTRHLGLSSLALSVAGLDTAVASLAGGNVAAGNYGAVNRWTQPLNIATTAFTTLMFPVAVKAASLRELWHKVRSAVFFPIAAIMAALCLFLAAPLVVPLVLGDAFVGSIPALRWLCVSAALGTCNQVTSVVLQARGQERVVARSLMVGVVVQLVLAAALAPRWGAQGIALASVASQLLFALGFVIGLRAVVRRGQPNLTEGSVA